MCNILALSVCIQIRSVWCYADIVASWMMYSDMKALRLRFDEYFEILIYFVL